MASIEQEIVEKVGRLDAEKKRQVLGYVNGLLTSDDASYKFDVKDWFDRIEAFQTELKAKYGDTFAVGSQGLLDELREEASWPRW